MSEIITIEGEFLVFPSRRPVENHMRFEVEIQGTLYICSVAIEASDMVGSGESSNCKFFCVVSELEKVKFALKELEFLPVKFGALDVGLIRNFRLL